MCNSLEGLINRRPELREPAKAHYDSCAYDKFLHNPPLTKEEVGLRSTMREVIVAWSLWTQMLNPPSHKVSGTLSGSDADGRALASGSSADLSSR